MKPAALITDPPEGPPTEGRSSNAPFRRLEDGGQQSFWVLDAKDLADLGRGHVIALVMYEDGGVKLYVSPVLATDVE